MGILILYPNIQVLQVFGVAFSVEMGENLELWEPYVPVQTR